jgi:hypothetical protein
MSDRELAGEIEAGKSKYLVRFEPLNASLASSRLIFNGIFKVQLPDRHSRSVGGVTATLLGVQGNAGAPPPLPRSLNPGLKPPVGTSSNDLPLTESTGETSSVAVMYLKLSPLDGAALGVPLDLSNVQLNARLYPDSELERDLQWLYSSLILAAHTKTLDEQTTTNYLREINRRLKTE